MMDLQDRKKIIARIASGTQFTTPDVCPSEGWNCAAHEGLSKAEAARLVVFLNGRRHPGPVQLVVRPGNTISDNTATAEVIVALIENAFANPQKASLPPEPLDIADLGAIAFWYDHSQLPPIPGVVPKCERFQHYLPLYAAAPRLLEAAIAVLSLLDRHREIYGCEKAHYVIDEGPEWSELRLALDMVQKP